jgi:rod shape-determining protein MreD
MTLALLAAVVVAQTALMPFAALGSAKPLLPVLAVVSWGLLRGPAPAVWWALTMGALLDALSPAPFGFYTLPLIGAAAVASVGRRRLSGANVLLPGIAAAAATVAFALAQRVLLWLTLRQLPEASALTWRPYELANELAPVTALSLLWLPALYFPLRFLAARSAAPSLGWER